MSITEVNNVLVVGDEDRSQIRVKFVQHSFVRLHVEVRRSPVDRFGRNMVRCFPRFCLPRKKRQSLPIGEQRASDTRHHQEEINKLFVRRVESIRVTQQGAIAKHLPTLGKNQVELRHPKTKKKKFAKLNKADDTEFDCETHLSVPTGKTPRPEKSTRKPLDKLFHKSSHIRDLHPSNSSLSSSVSSDWSTSTYSDSESTDEKSSVAQHQKRTSPIPPVKHRSCVESFYLGRENVRQNNKEQRNSQPIRQAAKSKQVLQNVRQMIKDQSVVAGQEQRESVRL